LTGLGVLGEDAKKRRERPGKRKLQVLVGPTTPRGEARRGRGPGGAVKVLHSENHNQKCLQALPMGSRTEGRAGQGRDAWPGVNCRLGEVEPCAETVED